LFEGFSWSIAVDTPQGARYTLIMANKEQRRNKEKKKPATKSLKEKRAEKRAKKQGGM
jgi:hypothetical protein